MREIKFRAWYGSKLGMMTPSFNGDINEIFAQKHGDYMQFTGLKDCNGVEIYEGDIIHCVHWFFNGDEIEEHFTASVGFRDGSFTLENIKSRYYSDFTGEEYGKGICWIGDINYCEEDYEVIGNIYENPELLTEK
ncbi:YopX family protein [Bacillus safensis]|uniref:YopX family protein n=1 Tax=Bacillus safensis TaxID=561879 RepID=UPI002DBED389|nr:YopX family protein [Bacillus safensis]MEC0921433.1 YopX family protein [Bacillus safensis]MEC0996979.1 YopX family protein [Bacillus safensis]MEC1000830.1 YopX family protein [Bacillus safensis]